MQSYFFRRTLKAILILAFLIARPFTLPAYGAGGDVLSAFGDSPQPGKQEAAASAIDSDGNVIVTGYRNVDGGIKDAYYTVKFNTYSGTVSWRATLDKSADSDRATAVTVDSEKNIIVTGYAWNGLNKDIHTVKYDGKSGAVMWEHTFNGNAKGHDVATAVAVDSLNNIYVAGHSQNSDGNNDFLILKYSTNGPDHEGKPAWNVVLDGRIDFPAYPDKAMFVDEVKAIAIGINHVTVTGYSWNGTDFDYLTGKYTLDGSLVWKKRHSSPGMYSDMAQFVKMDAAGNITVTGTTSNVSDNDITTIKYDGAGTLIWSKTYNGGYNDEPGGLAVDGSGDAYVTGYTFTLDGNKNFYTVKYRDPVSGSIPIILWDKLFNSAGDNADVPSAIMLDAVGNVYVTGYTFSGSNYDFQTIKYKNEVGAIEGAQNNDGAELWHSIFDGTARNNDIPAGISVYTNGGAPGVFVSGWSEQAAAGDYDYYVVKYDAGALNPPSDVTAGTLSKDAVTGKYSIPLSWIVNSTTEEGFVIERKDPGSQTFVKVTTTPADPLPPATINYTDSGLTEDSYYCYRIKAISESGDSTYSDPVCVLTMVVTPVIPDWNYHYNGRNDSDDFVSGIAVGKDGNPVVTGYSLDFAPGYSDGTISTDYFTAKLKATDKSVIWSDQFEGGFNQEDDAKGLAIDGNDDVVVTGNSYQDVGGAENINSIYTIKYSAAAPAARLWQGQYNGPSQIDDRAKAVAAAIDGSNNSVVIGHGKNAAGNEDIYVVKYAANAALDGKGMAIPLWHATPFDGGGNDYPHAVTFDKDGNIFVAGYRESAPDSNSYNYFTAKYCGSGTANPTCNNKNQGEIVWTDIFNGTGNGDDQPRGIAVDDKGDVYVTGYALNNAASKNEDFVTVKFDGKTGARLWNEPKSFDGDYHGSDRAVAIKVDPIDNNIVVTGTTETGLGDHDFHTIRYTPEGEVVWQRTHKKIGADDNANAMGMDLSGNIFIVGNTTAGFNTDSTSIIYDFEGNLLGETIYNNTAIVNGIDEAAAVAVNKTGEAFVAGYSTNAGSGPNGPNADFLVYKIAGVPLQAPSPFTAGENYTSAILAWTNNPGIKTGYDLERKIGSCTNTEIPWITLSASPLAATATTYTDKGLTEGKTYCYRIRAFAATGRPTRWIEREIVMENPPPPGALTATPVDTTTVNLAWAETTNGESGFQIQRCDGDACTFLAEENLKLFSAAPNATSFVDESGCPSTTYRYRILAYKNNEAGTGIEWDSAYTTISTPVVMPTSKAPGSLSAEPVMESQVKLTWTDTNNDETGYKIFECPAGNCSAVTSADLVGTTTANANTFTHTRLMPNSTHKYLVRPFRTAPQSCNGGWEGTSAESNSVATSNTPPVLQATKISTTQINLSWSDPTAAETSFQLQRCKPGAACTGNEQDSVKYDVIQFGSDITSYSDTGVCQNTSYLYRIRPVNEGSFRRKALIAITGFQQNFQTKITINRADFPGMQSDYADIGFYDETASTELPFWIDRSKTNATVATVWFKTGLNNNIYLHYGNSTSASASNGLATFEYFDNFDGASLGAAWAQSITPTAALTVSDGVVTLDAPTKTNATITKGLTPPYRIEARTKVYSTYLGSNLIRVRGLGGIGDTGIYDVGGSKLVAYFNYSNSTKQVPADTFVRWRAAHTGGSTNSWSIYNEDETLIYSTTYNGSPSGISLSVGDGGGGTGKISLDWIMVRKYAATEPTVASIGTPVEWGSTFSNPWTGSWGTIAEGTFPAAAPTGATASRVSEREIKITLNHSATDLTGIKVDRCTDQNCTEFAKNLEVLPGVPTVSDNMDLLPDTTYYYLIHSYKTATCSWDSKDITPIIVSATTTLVAPTISSAPATSINTSCNDLRFVDGAGNAVNYYIESGCNSASTLVWLKPTSLSVGSNTIYAYYANPAAAPQASDPAVFFEFFDNFAGTTLDTATKWTRTDSCGGAPSFIQNNGLNVIGGCSTWGYNGMYTKKDFNRPFIIEFSHYHNGGNYAMFGAKNTTTSSRYSTMPYAIYPIYDANGDRLQVYEDGVDKGDGKKAIARNAWQYYKLEVLTTGANYYHGNSPAAYTNYYTSSYSSASPLKFGIDVYNQSFSLGTVKVRKYANPQPTFTLLAEEPGSYLNDNAWGVKRPVSLTNSSGGNLLSYQMPITLDTTSLASDQVVISWTAGTMSEQRYKIDRCEGAGCSTTAFTGGIQKTYYGQPATSSYADRDVKPGTKYCYRVSAERHELAPLWATAPSGIVCATTSAIPVAPNLTVVEHETSMDLSWNDVGSGENAYILQRCTGNCNPIANPELSVTLAPGTTTFTDTTVCTNSYTYAVKAVKYGPSGWDSGFSIPVTKTTVPAEPPIMLSAVAINENQINLVWQDKTGDETGFKIDRCEGAGCDFTTKITLERGLKAGVGEMISYSDSGIKPNATYRYKVMAYKTSQTCGWESSYSEIREATTSVAAPTALSGIAGNTTTINLTWLDKTQSDSGFKVERCVVSGSCATPMDFTSVIQPAVKKVFYSFNNTLADSSGNSLHLTGSTPTYDEGGLALSTTTSFQSGITSILNNDIHAIEFDFKIRATSSTYAKIFGYTPGASDRSPGIWLKDGNSPSLHWRYHDAGRANTGVTAHGIDGDGSIPFTIGQWYHVRGAKNGNSFKIYINGTLVSDTTVANPKYAGDSVLSFGGADVTIKNFSIDGNESLITVADTNVCSDTAYNYRVKAVNTTSQQYDGPYSSTYTVVTPAIGNNLIPANADFNSGLSNWTAWGTGASPNSMIFSGMKSAKVSATLASGSQSTGVTQNLRTGDVAAGRSYRLYANIKANLDKTGTGTTLAFCRLDNTSIGNPDTLGRELQIKADSSWNDNTWHHMPPLDVTLKPGVTSARVMCGIWSSDGQNKTHTAYFTGLQLIPNPVVELTAARTSEAHVTLSWKDAIPDKSGYRLERCNKATCQDADFIQLGNDIPASNINYIDVVPAANVTYTYRVKAIKTATCSWSVTSNTVPVLTDVTPPANFTANSINTTRIDLNWGNSTMTETGFTLERCTGYGCSDYSPDFIPTSAQPGPGAVSFSDTSVCNNTTYHYRLKSYKKGLSKGGASNCWTRKKELVIANHVPAFQMRYTVAKDDNMEADYRDLRFYDATANIELPYYIESYDATSAKVLIKTGSSQVIQMYYGNNQASAVSNPGQVFDFYDDFAGTTMDTGKWTKVDPNGNISQNNELILSGGASWTTGLFSVRNFSRPFVLEVNTYADTGSINYSSFGVKRDTNTVNLYSDFIHNFYISYYDDIRIYEGSSEKSNTGQVLPEAAYRYFRIDNLLTGAKFYYGNSFDSATKYYDSSYNSESPLKIGFSNNSRIIRYDNVRVRRYAAVEPTVSTTGAEEILSSCPVFPADWESTSVTAQSTTPSPVAPSELSLKVVTDTRIDLNWADLTPDETGFRIERCEDTGSGCIPAALSPPVLVGAASSSYNDINASASVKYCYRVRATKNVTCEWDSGATDIACARSLPGNAGNTLVAVPENSRRIRLTWEDKATDENGYEVAIKLWNGRWSTIKVLDSNSTEYVHAQGLEPNKTYTYMVRPFRKIDDVMEYSPYSNPASATTPLFANSPQTCP